LPKRKKLSRIQRMTSSPTWNRAAGVTTAQPRPPDDLEHVLEVLGEYAYRARAIRMLEMEALRAQFGQRPPLAQNDLLAIQRLA
jgi:hypothetical protein